MLLRIKGGGRPYQTGYLRLLPAREGAGKMPLKKNQGYGYSALRKNKVSQKNLVLGKRGG